MERWRVKAEMLEGVARTGRFPGVEPWSTSGGQVPVVLQTFLRLAYVVGRCTLNPAHSPPPRLIG